MTLEEVEERLQDSWNGLIVFPDVSDDFNGYSILLKTLEAKEYFGASDDFLEKQIEYHHWKFHKKGSWRSTRTSLNEYHIKQSELLELLGLTNPIWVEEE